MLYDLLDSLKKELETHFAETLYEQAPPRKARQPVPGTSPEDGETWRSPVFYVGDLPPKRSQPEAPEDFPYVLIRLPDGETGRDEDNAYVHAPNIRILCGTWTDDGEEAQHAQISQITYRIIQWLLENRIVARRYERRLPMKWGFGITAGESFYTLGGQPNQYSVSWINVTFNLRAETTELAFA